jgi:hypothetical protein
MQLHHHHLLLQGYWTCAVPGGVRQFKAIATCLFVQNVDAIVSLPSSAAAFLACRHVPAQLRMKQTG